MGYGRTNVGGGKPPLPKLVSIAITTNPTKITYNVGESFSTSGMIVTAYFDDGSNSVITGYTYSPITVPFGKSNIIISYTHEGITKQATVSVEAIQYFYKTGDVCTAITGGWEMLPMHNGSGGGYPSLEFTDDYMRLRNGTYYSNARTINKVNLTNINTLELVRVNLSETNNTFFGATNVSTAYFSEGNSPYDTWSGENYVKCGSSTEVNSLDVSSLTGDYYIVISDTGNNEYNTYYTYIAEVRGKA